MAYKPGDFSIGIIDFLGILLPGAILMFLHGDFLLQVFGTQITMNGQIGLWVVFFVWSYIVGHFLLGLGVPLNRLQEIYLREENDHYYSEVVTQIKLPPHIEPNREDCYYRAFSFVRLYSPAAISEVDRQAAEYKLFRSLTLVFLFDIPLALARGVFSWPRTIVACVLAGLALWRFLFLLDWARRLTFEFYHLMRKGPSVEPAA